VVTSIVVAQIDLTVGLVAAGCLVTGLGLAVATWRLWVSAEPESPARATLEIMSETTYWRADDQTRAALVESVRLGPEITPPQKASAERIERDRIRRQQRDARRAARRATSSAPADAIPAGRRAVTPRTNAVAASPSAEPRVRRTPVTISTNARRPVRDPREDDSGGRPTIDPLLR